MSRSFLSSSGRLICRAEDAARGGFAVSAKAAEGLYVRREANSRLIARAKVVRAEFVQAIEEHCQATYRAEPARDHKASMKHPTGITSSQSSEL